MPAAVARGRLHQGACEFLYVTSAFPLGLLWLVALTVGVSVGVGLSVVILGLPILAVTMVGWRGVAALERERAALVTGFPIAAAERPLRALGTVARMRERAGDPATWRDLGYVALMSTLGLLMGTFVLAMWSGAAAAIAYPVVRPAMPPEAWLVRQGDLLAAGVVAAGVVTAVMALVATSACAHGWAALARRLLAPTPEALLAQRIVALEDTRAGVVESADATLRRIERDLHDGAQHRLAFIAMNLSRAQEKLATEDADGAAALLDDAHSESKKAMKDLRDLVRGIHPSVLADRGLDAAVSGIAGRSPVPVAVSVDLGARRPPAAAETAAYFVVAESLTNVAKHSGATRATVEILWDDAGRLVVTIADDGGGGARRTPGSGLEGLAQRLEALDGTFTVTSPVGGPSIVQAVLPCAS